MKNFFTSVRLPRGKASGELGECIRALGELITQLRLTVNSIDIDNMSEGLRKKLNGIPTLHEFHESEEINYSSMNDGDLILIYTELHGGINKIIDAYIYKKGGIS
jgi:hypothetical protein